MESQENTCIPFTTHNAVFVSTRLSACGFVMFQLLCGDLVLHRSWVQENVQDPSFRGCVKLLPVSAMGLRLRPTATLPSPTRKAKRSNWRLSSNLGSTFTGCVTINKHLSLSGSQVPQLQSEGARLSGLEVIHPSSDILKALRPIFESRSKRNDHISI